MTGVEPPSKSPTPPPREQKPGPGEPRRPMPFSLVLVLIALFILLVTLIFRPPPGTRVNYVFFVEQLRANNVERVKIEGQLLTGKWKDSTQATQSQTGEDKPTLGKDFHTWIPLVEDRTLLDLLEKNQAIVEQQGSQFGELGQLFVIWVLPMLLIIGLILFLRRSMDPTAGMGMFGNVGRSPARRARPEEQRTTMDDVADMEYAKRELQEVVEFLKNPAKFQRLGAEIPKGVLLMGPPGTGKTLLARATAGEAGVPFFSINGSEFIQMFVGVGASRVRDLFRTAKGSAPSLVFIDEIDAVGRVRGAGFGGGHDEREQTLNQILSEMDGFTPMDSVIVIAATNRPDVLDPALLRPGRFDRHVTIDRPSRRGRLAILKVHTRKVPLGDKVDLEKMASSTIGFSGAELRNLVNEAALNAVREGKSLVDNSDFDQARDKIIMGARRDDVMNEREREMTAYHEAGHALLAWTLPDVDPVHKVTIIPRGRALGVTQMLPVEERHSIGERRLHAMLAMMLGGRAAEKLVFDEFTANAEDDLRKATDLSRRMVAHWGMSAVIGPAAFRQSEESPFLGKEYHEHRVFSEETTHVIDQEVQRILSEAQSRAIETLKSRRDDLERLSNALVEREMLDHDEIVSLIGPPAARSTGPQRAET